MSRGKGRTWQSGLVNIEAYNWWRKMAQEHGAGLMHNVDAAAVLGISRQRMHQLLQMGRLPRVPRPSWAVGRRIRWVPVQAVLDMAEKSILDKADALHRLGPGANAPVRRLLGLPPRRQV